MQRLDISLIDDKSVFPRCTNVEGFPLRRDIFTYMRSGEECMDLAIFSLAVLPSRLASLCDVVYRKLNPYDPYSSVPKIIYNEFLCE